MTKNSTGRISAIALLLSLFLGMIAFGLMGAGGSTTSAFVAQNTNKGGATKSTKKPSTSARADCSKADDAALGAQIRERLSKRASLKYEKQITVDVKAGVATLSGKVQLRSHRITAAAEAKKVKCIKSVVGNILYGCVNCKTFCCDDVCQSQQCADKTKKPK